MSLPEDDPGRQRTESLHHATLDLERALASPADPLDLWGARVRDAARTLDLRLVAHAVETEAPGEFLDTITVEAPHLVSSVHHLEDEHIDLTTLSADLVGLVDGLGEREPAIVAEDVRRAAAELLDLLERHRRRGTDLTFMAHNADLGSSG